MVGLVAALATIGASLTAPNARPALSAPPRGSVAVPARSSIATAAATQRSVSLLCDSASPLMGAFEVRTGSQGQPSFYVTHNFSSYTPVSVSTSPSLPTPRWALCETPHQTSTVRWTTRLNAEVDGSLLYETTDGGKQWSLVGPLRCGGSSPWAWVKFANATDGWLAAGDIGSNCSEFKRTLDDGRTWQTLPHMPTAMLGSLEFVSPLSGFAPGESRRTLAETRDGGLTWHTVKVPIPAAGTPGLSLPVFSGERGVLPMIVSRIPPSELTTDKAVPVAIAFDRTSDGGRRWISGPIQRAVARTGLEGVAHLYVGQVEDGPAVTVASTSTWWVLTLRSSGAIQVRVTVDAGTHWAVREGVGLPRIDIPLYLKYGNGVTPIPGVGALNGRIAIARVFETPGTTATYITTDGGSHWLRLTTLTFGRALTAVSASLLRGVVRGPGRMSWREPDRRAQVRRTSTTLSPGLRPPEVDSVVTIGRTLKAEHRIRRNRPHNRWGRGTGYQTVGMGGVRSAVVAASGPPTSVSTNRHRRTGAAGLRARGRLGL